MDQGQADIFITYCTNAVAAQEEVRRLKIVAIPPNLQVFADYGLTVRRGAHPAAQAFADTLLAPKAQAVFVRYGFGSP
jgi:accessory colonization factor AcfC